MKFGEQYKSTLVDSMSGRKIPYTATYKYAEWNGYHTDSDGCGLWACDKQILGTCQFSVRGCKLEKSAKAKIRQYVMGREA